MKTIIEPFRIRSVEPIYMSTCEEREKELRTAGDNLFQLPANPVIIEILTDSGTGVESSRGGES